MLEHAKAERKSAACARSFGGRGILWHLLDCVAIRLPLRSRGDGCRWVGRSTAEELRARLD